ncbi:DNA-binding transcriptional MerR regulator [Arthrobacter sp. CAN_A212]
MTGVSARTLRHYDEIGLLAPAALSSNGYRWYGRNQLRRLQRILLLRELDVPLAQIIAILAGEDDETAALRSHLMLVTAERDRLEQVAATIIGTLDDLERNDRLPDEEFFRGLDEKRSKLAVTLRERFGEAAVSSVEAADMSTAQWTRRDYDQAAADGQELYTRMSHARQSGVLPTSPSAHSLVAEHHTAVQSVWPVDGASYYALAELIENDPGQRDAVAINDPDLPRWVAAAIRSYATDHLQYRLP